MLTSINRPCKVLVVIIHPLFLYPPGLCPAAVSELRYIAVSTTARLYCRFAVLLPSPSIELWCLCYIVVGLHLATAAVDITEDDLLHKTGVGLQPLHHRTYGGSTTQHFGTIKQNTGEYLHKRINEVNDQLVNHRQSNNNILIASLQSHIKQFSKIRTTEGGYRVEDPRQVRDIGEDLPVETVTESVAATVSTSTSEPWILPDTIATTGVTTPPAHMSPVHPTAMDSMGSNVVVFVLVLALVLATLGVLTCILSTYRYRTGGGGGGGMGGRARSELPSDTPGLLGSNANLPMLALPGGMCEERDVAALRDRHVRLKSVRTDMELDLPPNIRLPDGEELPYGCATRLHLRDPDQESEIYQKCVRPPPNRTVFDGESPPPYRSSSAGLLSHATPGSIDWAQDTPPEKVIRCHSMSSGSSRSVSTTSTAPAVVVPTRSRRLSAFSDTGATGGALSQLTMVPCHRGAEPPV